MTGRRGLRDRLRDKLKITSSSKVSESSVANDAQTQPHLVHASQATSRSEYSSTIDGAVSTNHVTPSKDSVPSSAETNKEVERHDGASPPTVNPAVGTANPEPQTKNQATRTQVGFVRSAIKTLEQTEINHVDLWDRAYEMLRSRDKSLVEKYEKILDDELRASISSTAVLGAITSVGMSVGLKGDDSTPNATDAATTLAVLGSPARQEQMKSLVQEKIKKYEDSAWKFKIGSKSVVVRDQTEKFVNAIMFAKSFVDSVVASDPHVALAWTGVCILLPLVVIPSKQRAAQSKGLSDIADLIQHYSTAEKVYRGRRAADTIDQDFKDDFEDKLTMLYSQILQYQAQTICQISRNVLLRSFSLPSTWESLLTEIKNSDIVCRQKMDLLSDFRINEVRIETQNLSQYLETRFNDLQDSSLRENIRQWLLPPSLNTGEGGVTTHDRHCMDREAGTCEWYLDGDKSKFQEWLQSESQVLWLYGDVGCGKTVMWHVLSPDVFLQVLIVFSAAIVEKLKEIGVYQEVYSTAFDAVNIAKSSIAYFYFSFDPSTIQDPNYFLRAVIAQLCLGDTVHPQLAETYRNTRGWAAPSYDNLYQILVSVVSADEDAHITSRIKSSLRQKSVFLVLDGLDEIPQERDKTFKLIRKLVSLKSSRLRIIITSRWHSGIEAILQQSTMLTEYEIPRTEVERDIQSYLKAQMVDDSRFSPQVQERICERLSDGGVFYLAALQLQELQQYPLERLSLQDLEEILQNLPQKLAECYNRILEKIPQTPAKLRNSFFTALKWIVLSQRPLYIEEAAEACMIDVARCSVDTTRFISSRDVVNNLLGLVSIKPRLSGLHQPELPRQTHTVSLAHFSVQEYLIFYEGFSQPPGLGRFDAALAQTFIAQSCFIYLSECCSDTDHGMDIWPLKAYAWTYWAAHAQAGKSLRGIPIQPDAMRLFNQTAFPLLYTDPHPKGMIMAKESPPETAYWELRECLPPERHYDLLDALQDPTFPEDSISYYKNGKEYQGFKSKKPHVEQYPQEPPLYFKTRRQNPRTYYLTKNEGKLSNMPLLLDPLTIRLLIVLPSPDKYSTIECHLCSDSLHNKPKYTALAYGWGTYTGAFGILVNGQSFYVRDNLYGALRELRDAEAPRVFWIDAICIDMGNLAERSSQVRLMTEVYSSAEQVCVWLGSYPRGAQYVRDGSDHAEDYKMPREVERARFENANDAMYLEQFSGALTQCGKYISEGTWIDLQHLSPLWKRGMEKVLKSVRDARSRERRGNWIWKAETLFNQIFWRSCWIVQEVLVAAKVTVRLGSFTIDWEDIPEVRPLYEFLNCPTRRLARYQRIGETRITGVPSTHPFHLGWAAVEILQQLRKRYQAGQELTLPELLNLTRYHYSSDGRDKIFAIFSILPEHERNHKLLQPDYSLSLAEVYTKAAEYVLERYQNLDILSVCHGIPPTYKWAINNPKLNEKPDLRSWVPNWTTDSGLPMAPGIFSTKQAALFKAGESLCYFQIDTKDQLRVLIVKGIIIDRIGPVAHMIPDFHCKKFVMPGFENEESVQGHASPTNYPTDQMLQAVFWRTILTDRWISENGEVSRLSIDSNGILNNILPRWQSLESIAKRRLQNDLLCMECSISAEGRSLMVPWDAEAGDVIVVLSGGKVPYVLRKDEGLEGEYYKLVGECYVHGMMDGEALKGSEHKVQEFHLI